MDLRGKKIVVIGGAGFIGSHTVDLLTEEDVASIVIYDDFSRGTHENLSKALRDPRVEVFAVGGNICHADILREALRGADGVFHFAALWLLQCQEYPRAAFDVNVGGTFNVLEACVANGVGRLVYSSSASVYGDAVEEPMDEEHPLNNRNFYGATKIAGEALLRAFHHRFQLPCVGLRYMNVYGPRQRNDGIYGGVVTRMLAAIEEGGGPEIEGDGTQCFDFVHVTDCARANLAALRSDFSDRFYNIGTGTKTSVRTVAEMLVDLTGTSASIRFRPPRSSAMVRNRVACTGRARHELGFESATSLQAGLASLVLERRQARVEGRS